MDRFPCRAKPRAYLASILLCLLFCCLLTAAHADEKDVVPVQVDAESTIWRTYHLSNGETWINGTYESTRTDWLAKVNRDGTIADFYDGIGSVVYVALCGDKRFALTSHIDETTFVYSTKMITLEGNGQTGEPVDMGHFASGMQTLSTGMLVYSVSLSEPWFTLYDSNLNVLKTIGHPLDAVPELREQGHSYSFSALKETPDGMMIAGVSSNTQYYLMKLSHSGAVDSYQAFELGLNAIAMAFHGDQLILAAWEWKDHQPGAIYLICAQPDGTIVWKNSVLKPGSGVTIHKIMETEYGFILFGIREVEFAHAQHRIQPVFITATHDGKILNTVDLPYISDYMSGGFVSGNDLFVLGNGTGANQGKVVFEIIPLDTGLFIPQ